MLAEGGEFGVASAGYAQLEDGAILELEGHRFLQGPTSYSTAELAPSVHQLAGPTECTRPFTLNVSFLNRPSTQEDRAALCSADMSFLIDTFQRHLQVFQEWRSEATVPVGNHEETWLQCAVG